uniref:Secreted protein n=1 Tax=Rhipicephalus appendiculatus TaxID=34631 RepID=A0A131YAJ2_RHIAP
MHWGFFFFFFMSRTITYNSLSLPGQKNIRRKVRKKGALMARTVIQQTSTMLATQAQNLEHLMSHTRIRNSNKRNSRCALSFSLTLCERTTSHNFGRQQQQSH